MDRAKIADALRAALQSGVVEHPGPDGVDPTSDIALITKAADVATLNPETLTALGKLIETMAQDSTFAALANKHVSGGGLRSIDISLHRLARIMLAQAMARGDVDKIVTDTAQILEANEANVLFVMALLGVRVERETQLGPNVRLIPVSSLPPSMPRGQALGQQLPLGVGLSPWRRVATAALTIEGKVSPLVGNPQELAGGGKQYLDAMSALDEARDCLNLIGLCAPIPHSSWAQFLHPVPAYWAEGSAWSIGEQSLLVEIVDIDANEAEQLGAAYFVWPKSDREKALHVPLNRLARAVRQRNPVDQAIDLGIALDALLLHDAADRGELAYQLALRGAWLGGDDADSRMKLFSLLKSVYDLRSGAVHAGVLRQRRQQNAADVLQKGLTVCADLIRAAIDKGGIIQNWPAILTGAETPGPLGCQRYE